MSRYDPDDLMAVICAQQEAIKHLLAGNRAAAQHKLERARRMLMDMMGIIKVEIRGG